MKIHIIGGPASGKTWLANHLSSQFKVSAFNLDDIFWDKNSDRYGIQTSPEKRDDELRKILAFPSWIIEGVYYSWLMHSFQSADLIVVLKVPTALRDFRILKRFVKRKSGIHKTKHESIANVLQLIMWNHRYHKNNLLPALEFISDYKEKTIFPETTHQVIEEIKKRNIFA
jgi:adenylate kinase family enzyme